MITPLRIAVVAVALAGACWLERVDTPTAAAESVEPASAYVSGLVVDADGHPIAGAVVVATSAHGERTTADLDGGGVVTDEHGRFAIRGLAPGDYYFTALHGDHPPGSTRAMPVDASGQTLLRIILRTTEVIFI